MFPGKTKQMAHDDRDRELRQAHGSTGEPIEVGLARALSELAREMQAEPDTAGLLQRIAEAAITEIEGTEYAGISLIAGNRVRTEAATDELVRQIDKQQYQLGEGPCLNSLREEVTVRSDDLDHEDRWPRFVAAAKKHGVQSVLCVQLFVDGDNLGALNMFATRAHAFDHHDETVAMLLASHAAIAMKGSAVEHNLRVALESRDTIGQAKGILMERFKISPGAAFDLLVAASQRTHHKLRDVAETLTATGEWGNL